LQRDLKLFAAHSGLDVALLQRALALVQKWKEHSDKDGLTPESPEQVLGNHMLNAADHVGCT